MVVGGTSPTGVAGLLVPACLLFFLDLEKLAEKEREETWREENEAEQCFCFLPRLTCEAISNG
jgi:hypothetical protein